ncbi:MAG TPA: DUF2512 family protein [Bacillales bacterium]|nr:DUF2512 family protein [Bacillales bacterium]
MKNFSAIISKYVIVTVLMFATTGILFNWTLGHIMVISMFITGTTYILSDVFILPALGNFPAAVTDFTLSLLGSWAVGTIVTGGGHIPLLQGPLMAATIFTLWEGLFFHRFLEKIQPHESHQSTA